MNDPTVARFIVEARQALAQIAENAMRFPKADPFEHGSQVGRYQGLDFALEIMNDILRGDDEKERNS
jgi:hypothetical protein